MLLDKGLQFGVDTETAPVEPTHLEQEDEPQRPSSIVVDNNNKNLKSAFSSSYAATRRLANDAAATAEGIESGNFEGGNFKYATSILNGNYKVNENYANGSFAEQPTLQQWPYGSPAQQQQQPLEEISTYRWRVSLWSECSQKCGAAGSGLKASSQPFQFFLFNF